MQIARVCAVLTIAVSLSASFAVADVVTIGASRDNTLYEDLTGSVSNGRGAYLFAGRIAPNGGGLRRRAVLAFDVAANVPSGATINSVALTLHMSRTNAGPNLGTLRRLSKDWGEGNSNAGSPGGAGAAAAAGDATWIHSSFDTDLWTVRGGDIVATAGVTKMIGAIGFYVWSGAEMATDVQAWLDQPSDNHGWVLIVNESTPTTAKRFDSREIGDQDFRPALEIDFTFVPPPPPPPPAVPTASSWSAALVVAMFATALIVGGGGSDSANRDSLDQ